MTFDEIRAANTEADFVKLLETGWPEPVVRAKPERYVAGILDFAFILHALSHIHSRIPETRAFWRAKLGLPAEDATP